METVERTISWLLKNQKGRDAKLIIKNPIFASQGTPTIAVESPDCGPSNSILDVDHTADGKALCPSLNWTLPSTIAASSVKEYAIIIEDADVPLPTPIMHAAYYQIPPNKTSLAPTDLELTGRDNELKGGFRYGKNLRKVVYVPPRPLRGHGPHRYFFFVIALSAPVGEMSVPATKEEIVEQMNGKILGWGQWVGVAERK